MPGAGLGGQLGGLLLPRDHRGGPRAHRGPVRALHLQGAPRAPRHRCRFRARAPRGRDPVPLREVRPRARRPHRHRDHLPPEERDPRRGQGPRPRARRGGPAGQERLLVGREGHRLRTALRDRAGPREPGHCPAHAVGAGDRRVPAPPLPACRRVRDLARAALEARAHRERRDGGPHRHRVGQDRSRCARPPQDRLPGARDAVRHPPGFRSDPATMAASD